MPLKMLRLVSGPVLFLAALSTFLPHVNADFFSDLMAPILVGVPAGQAPTGPPVNSSHPKFNITTTVVRTITTIVPCATGSSSTASTYVTTSHSTIKVDSPGPSQISSSSTQSSSQSPSTTTTHVGSQGHGGHLTLSVHLPFPFSPKTGIPLVSIVVSSSKTGSYTPTLITTLVSSTVTTFTTDASGSTVGIIVYPSASGWGWVFPCSLGSCGTPFPPPPKSPPPSGPTPGIISMTSSGSTGAYTPTQISSKATLSTTLWTTTTDSAGSTVGIIIYPSSGGSGYAFPCILGFCNSAFPPPPRGPPLPTSQSSSNTPPKTNPYISFITSSSTTESFTPTQVAWDTSLTSTLTTSATDEAGTPFCLIVFPSDGLGWAYPYRKGSCASIFPPPPQTPPASSMVSGFWSWQATEPVTSTMTTLPPGFSTEGQTNTQWTGNTWITTAVHGTSTIVPVIVGCKNCGEKGGGIIFWNLPQIPNITFKLPGFPKLPQISLPCVKILFVKIGNCSPKTESDNGSKGGGDDNDPTNNDPDSPEDPEDPENPDPGSSEDPTNDPEDDPDDPTSSPTSVSKSTSQSSSSCATQTASACSQIVSVWIKSGETTSTTTTISSCSRITACSVTGTTRTSTTTFSSEAVHTTDAVYPFIWRDLDSPADLTAIAKSIQASQSSSSAAVLQSLSANARNESSTAVTPVPHNTASTTSSGDNSKPTGNSPDQPGSTEGDDECQGRRPSDGDEEGTHSTSLNVGNDDHSSSSPGHKPGRGGDEDDTHSTSSGAGSNDHPARPCGPVGGGTNSGSSGAPITPPHGTADPKPKSGNPDGQMTTQGDESSGAGADTSPHGTADFNSGSPNGQMTDQGSHGNSPQHGNIVT